MTELEKEKITNWLKENKKRLAVICDIDKNENEYNHEVFLVPEDCENPDYVAFDLEIRKMEDVMIWNTNLEEAITLGFENVEDCPNY